VVAIGDVALLDSDHTYRGKGAMFFMGQWAGAGWSRIRRVPAVASRVFVDPVAAYRAAAEALCWRVSRFPDDDDHHRHAPTTRTRTTTNTTSTRTDARTKAMTGVRDNDSNGRKEEKKEEREEYGDVVDYYDYASGEWTRHVHDRVVTCGLECKLDGGSGDDQSEEDEEWDG